MKALDMSPSALVASHIASTEILTRHFIWGTAWPNICGCCSYTSEVTLEQPQRVISRVRDSTLFDHLDTTWEFQGGPTPQSCWLTFSTDFAFKSPLYSQLASVFFQEVHPLMRH